MAKLGDDSRETSPLLPKGRISHDEAESQTERSRIGWNIAIAIMFTWSATFLSALDSTITSTLSATIASEFDSLALISWLGSAYLMALAAVQPLSGKLTDIFGRRPCFLICVALFGLGNVICGNASSKEVIIIGRVVAGIGGGGINSITSFISSDLIPLRQRGLWHGMGTIATNTGLGLGGVVGGMINETWGWRWAFFIVIPFTIVSGIGVALFLPDYAPDREHKNMGDRLRRIDFGGSLTLISALVIFMYGLNSETTDGIPSALLLKVTMPIAAALLAVFVLIETRFAQEPILPIKLLRLRTVCGASLTGGFFSTAMYTLMFYVPIYFQLLGFGTRETGLLLLPQSIGGAIGAFLAGLMTRLTGKYGILKVVVLGLYVAGAIGFSTCTVTAPVILSETYLFIGGLGFGGMFTVMLLALLSSVDKKDQATTTAILYVFRTTGATLGVTLSSTVFRKVLVSSLPKSRKFDSSSKDYYKSAGFDGLDETLRECSHRRLGGEPSGLCPPQLVQAYMSALHATFLLALGFAIAGFVSGVLTDNNHLSKIRKAPADDMKNERRSSVNRDQNGDSNHLEGEEGNEGYPPP